jgi:predicted enzyme related to lactoylglutathione lyase
MKPSGPPPVESAGMPGLGTFCWYELMAADPEAAAKFYSEIYGWQIREENMGPIGVYRLCLRGDENMAGIMKTMPGGPPVASWLCYIVVDDVEGAVQRAERLGGRVCAPPADIPNIGRFAVLADPAGATFAAFKGSPKPDEHKTQQG